MALEFYTCQVEPRDSDDLRHLSIYPVQDPRISDLVYVYMLGNQLPQWMGGGPAGAFSFAAGVFHVNKGLDRKQNPMVWLVLSNSAYTLFV